MTSAITCSVAGDQLFEQDDAAGTGRGRDVDVVFAAVARGQGLALDGAVVGQVGGGDQPVAAAHLGEDGVGDRAVVERVRAAVGKGLERAGEVGLDEAVAGLPRAAAGLAVDPVEFGELGRRGGGKGLVRGRGDGGVHDKAVAGQSDGGLEEFRPREGAEAAVGELHAADRAGDGDRPVGELGFLLGVHPRGRGGGGALAVVDGHGGALAGGGTDEHEPAAGDVAGEGVGGLEGEGGGDGGVDGVAAASEDVAADIGGGTGDGDDEAVVALDVVVGVGCGGGGCGRGGVGGSCGGLHDEYRGGKEDRCREM
jgi:hypothetical protein